MQHQTVLRDEAVDVLAPTAGAVIVDATLGSGGHTKAIAERLGGSGRIIACDVDPHAIRDAQSWCSDYATHISLHQENFVNVHTCVASLGIASVDGILADLGWRSEQFATGGRGFSFQSEEPLIMTFGDPSEYSLTAADLVNEWAEEDLANVFYGYGEERYARRIARAIVSARTHRQITTAKELAEVITAAVPPGYRRGRTHPATKSFQAIRIAVNDELTVLDTFITHAFSILAPGGRLAIISFHSLEDRIVKHRFKDMDHSGVGTLLSKKPILPSATECAHNPRARSAKLRAIKKDPT